MKGFTLGIALVLVMPLAALAHSICPACQAHGNSDGRLIGTDFSGGTLTGSDAGLTLTGSTLTQVQGISGADLGTVTLQTGGLLSGSLQGGGSFAGGGSFVVTVDPNVLGGQMRGGGILFSGTFVSPVVFSPFYGDYPGYYLLQGTADGRWWNGTSGQAFVALDYYGAFNSNGVFTMTFLGGQAIINPEPGTLGLFVTGLIGIGAAIRRKMRL
jgi:hypothetical protein